MVEEIPYSVRHDPHYNEVAARTSRVELLPNPQKPESMLIEGPCARCRHPHVYEEPIVSMRGMNDRRSGSDPISRALRHMSEKVTSRVVTVVCCCQEQHPNTPALKSGCGAYWKLTIDWSHDG